MIELDHNRIINLTADGDRSTGLSIGVYKGNTSVSVFANKASVVRLPISRPVIYKLSEDLEKVIEGAPGIKIGTLFTKYDMESKKSSQLGSLYIGKDEKSCLYIGIQAPNHPAMKFAIKLPVSVDNVEPMDDAARSKLAARTIVQQLRIDIPHAMMLTSEKRPPQAGGGSYRSNAGGSSSGGNLF